MKQQRKTTDWYYLLPIIFFIGVIPLIVLLKVKPLKGPEFEFWTGEKTDADIFFFYKMLFIIITASFTMILLFFKSRYREMAIKRTYCYIPAGVYILFAYISTLMADYRDTALYGFPSHYEGMFVIFAYFVMMFAVINLVNSGQHVRILFGTLIISSFIICTMGIFQFFGYNFLDSAIGKSAVMLLDNHKIKAYEFMPGPHSIYATLYNSNYVGSYTAMILPLSITLYICIKNKYFKVLSGLFSCLVFANFIGCRSTAGVVGGVFAVIILLIFLRKHIIKNRVYIPALAVSYMLIFLIMNNYIGEDITGEIKNSFSTGAPTNPLKDIYTGSNTLTVITGGYSLKVIFDGDRAIIKNGRDESLKLKQQTEDKYIKYTFADEKYKDCYFVYNTRLKIFQMYKSNSEFNFVITTDGVMFVDPLHRLVALRPVKKLELKGLEPLGGGRMYIWSRAIPLLSDTILIGKGPDTFAIYFPQTDYIGKLYGLDTMNILVDKPHNMYLQTGITTGVVSLLSLLALFLMYFISSFRLFIKNEIKSLHAVAGLAVFSAFYGYVATGFFNDSVVSVAPVFWVLLGLGISMNLHVSAPKEQ